jgi:hypothetical protein
MFNFGDLGKMVQEMQENVKKTQEKLREITVEAETGGVAVTANCDRKILKIRINPELLKDGDTELMEDLICAAVNKALEKAEIQGKEAMKGAMDQLLPPGLGNLGGPGGIDLSKFGL